jgi:NAD(P)-dependent dehydrogenase (short-subunit alcohol dehydrogenase family)
VLRGLKDKVAIVTGAAGGLGGATARRLAHEGATVVCVDLDGDGAARLAGEVVSVDAGATTTNSLRPSGGAGRWDPTQLDRAMG